MTLRQGMAKHFTSALAVVDAASKHAGELLSDYAAFKKRACSGESAGKFKRVVLTGDHRALDRLRKQLAFAGVAAGYSAGPFDQPDAHDYWTSKIGATHFPPGSLVVDLAQPQGAFAKALLEPSSPFEDEFTKAQIEKRKAAPAGETYPGPDDAEFYDVTGWSLPFAHDLNAWWCESAPPVRLRGSEGPRPMLGTQSTVGYAIPYEDDEDALATFEALDSGIRASVSTRPMTLAGAAFPKGEFLFMTDRNDDGFNKRLAEIAQRHGSRLIPLATAYPDRGRYGPGSESVVSLRQPKIALVMGEPGRMTDCGAIWFLLERVWKLPFTPVTTETLSSGDIERFTCVLIPRGTTVPQGGKLRDWLEQGNVAVSMGDGSVVGSGKYAELSEVSGQIASLPGSLFRAEMNPRSFLSLGYASEDEKSKPEIAVPLEGSRFWSVRKEGGSVVAVPSDGKPNLLSGWEWPEDTEQHVKGTVVAQDAPVGRGHFVIFTHDPTERAMWPGLYKLVLNAMLIGGSLGD